MTSYPARCPVGLYKDYAGRNFISGRWSLEALLIAEGEMFYLVQACKGFSLHSKKKRNVYLHVLSCPKVLLCIVLDSDGVAKFLLLLRGDVRSNPEPMPNDQVKQFNNMYYLLEKLNSSSTGLEEM